MSRLLVLRGAEAFEAGDALERATAILDARHPYAAPLTFADAPVLRLVRAPWRPTTADRWFEAADIASLIRKFGARRRVFSALGHEHLPSLIADRGRRHFVRLRSGAPPAAPPHITFLSDVGPFCFAREVALFQRLGIEAVAARNDGGRGAAPKILAARAIGAPVLLLARPLLSTAFTTDPRMAARWVIRALRSPQNWRNDGAFCD